MMNPRIISVKPLGDYQLDLVFTNQEQKRFDVKPYLAMGVFQELQDVAIFNSVRPSNGSILWANDLDLDPDTLYLDSESI